MDLSLERKLFFNWEPKGFRFWREGTPPEGAALMAFTLCERGRYVRRWYLYPMNHFVDGVELQPPQVDCRLVNPATIALNVKAYNYVPDNSRLPSKPTRLAERWTSWHNERPRVVHFESITQRIRRFLS